MVDELLPGQLASPWRAIHTATWVGAIIALFAVNDTADFIGKPTWWQLHGLGVIPFVVPMIAGLVAYFNIRRCLWVSALGVVSLAVTAFVTRPAAPGAAVVEAAIAVAVFLLVVACMSGRMLANSVAAQPAPPDS
jgi:hypothetical protein